MNNTIAWCAALAVSAGAAWAGDLVPTNVVFADGAISQSLTGMAAKDPIQPILTAQQVADLVSFLTTLK